MKHIIKSYKTIKQFTDLTFDIKEFTSQINGNGLLHIFTRHTTCAVKILENEILLLADINNYFDKNFPKDGNYMHDRIEIRDVPVDERINAYSHLRQLGLSTSETIPVVNGEAMLGKWQTVFLIELDPIRDREVVFSFLEAAPN
jgi:secondary thiamine-phosphate synthase enzyme